MKKPFVKISLPCTFCGEPVARTRVSVDVVPWHFLRTSASMAGAVVDAAGNYYCNAACRMHHRLEKGVHHIETPEVEE